MKKLDQRLKELRESKNLTLAALAKELGVTYVAVGRWEKGIREPNIDMLILITKFFNVTLDFLVGLVDY